MSYKTIFTVMTEFDANSPVLTQAVALAASQDAHLEVMCLGLDRSHTNYYEVGASAVILQNSIEETNAKADAILAEASAFLGSTNLRWNALSTIATIGDVTRTVSGIARFSDLAIVALPYADNARSDDSVVLEAMLFDAACRRWSFQRPKARSRRKPSSLAGTKAPKPCARCARPCPS
ncbi:MAG: hypothetical protein HC814_01905 [Rhodobacteraceae bacterium]|nr:hypothetical protein [Paracoccaceae bacterium]